MSMLTPFPYPGAIDADGHILEPPDLWEKYIEPQYRDRTIRLRTNPRVGSARTRRRSGQIHAP
jgi:hypothetical protein